MPIAENLTSTVQGFALKRVRNLRCWAVSVGLLAVGGTAQAESPSLSQARRALEEGIPLIAIHKLTAGASSIPESEKPAAQLLLAEAQLASGLPDDAIKTLTPFADSNEAAPTLLRAHAFATVGRWEEALPLYQYLRDSHLEAALGEAESLQSLKRTSEAITALERLIQSGRAPNAARLRLASLLLEADRAGAARELLKGTQAGSPGENLWKQYIEARMLIADKKPQAALAMLEPMLRPVDGRRVEGLTGNLHAAATLARAEALLTPDKPEEAAKVLEDYIRENRDSPHLEIIFRRLDQLYALDKNPAESALQAFVKELPQRGRALAQFYVCKMQLRERKADRLKASIALFLKTFPGHPLTAQVREMEAQMALATATPATKAQSLIDAEQAFDAGSRAAPSRELRAEFSLRTALVNLQQGQFLLAVNHLYDAREVPRLRETAMFNVALAWLMQANYDMFAKEFAAFSAEFATPLLTGQLQLEQGLVRARTSDKLAAETLDTFLRDFPDHSRRGEAKLAAAELAFQAGNQAEAESLLHAASDEGASVQTAEHAAYFAVFLEDKRRPRDTDKVISLARDFIAKHPKSAKLADVRMKLGEVYFHRADFLGAQEQFELLAREQPDGDYAERALFLAGQCGMNLFTPENLGHALQLFDKVAERKGKLEAHARLQQAVIKGNLDESVNAVNLYDAVINSTTTSDPEIRHAALIGKGGALVRRAQKLPPDAPEGVKTPLLVDAIAAYDALLALKDINSTYRNQALYLKGKALLQLDRGIEALVSFEEALAKTATDMPPESFWLFSPLPGVIMAGAIPRETHWSAKAGFEAGAYLEARRDWGPAIRIYKKLGDILGPYASEAEEQIKRIQLEEFLWE